MEQLNIDLYSEIEQALKEHPGLAVTDFDDKAILIEGIFVLSTKDGPFDQFDVQIKIRTGFPSMPPEVVEVSDRIPKTADRHYLNNGNACLAYWPTWMIENKDHSFLAILNGPIKDWFISQSYFEHFKGEWPFGQIRHGLFGRVDAHLKLYDIDYILENNPSSFQTTGLLLCGAAKALLKKLKGHHQCFCGNGKKFRDCHQTRFREIIDEAPNSSTPKLISDLGDIIDTIDKILEKLKETNVDKIKDK